MLEATQKENTLKTENGQWVGQIWDEIDLRVVLNQPGTLREDVVSAESVNGFNNKLDSKYFSAASDDLVNGYDLRNVSDLVK